MASSHRSVRVAYLVSHPIQYQAPLLRRLARERGIELEVFFLSGYSTRKHVDPGFGRAIEWDVSTVDGYAWRELTDAPRVTSRSPYLPDIWSRIEGDRFDALWLHGWSQWTQLQALLAAKLRGKAVLVRGESKIEARSPLRRAALRALFRAVDGCLAIGRENRAFFEEIGVAPGRIFSMPYTVDVEFFAERARAARSRRAALRRELGIPADRRVILYASKMIERKRPGELLAAFERMPSDARGAAHLLFVGDGPERAPLKAEARARGLGSVTFAGFRNQTELPALYDLCDVFVLPSAYETWGLVVNEAMAAGRPVVTTSGVGCAADLVVPGETGHVYAPGDADALANKLAAMLADVEGTRRMGRAARRRLDDFDLEACCRGFRDAVKEVCAA